MTVHPIFKPILDSIAPKPEKPDLRAIAQEIADLSADYFTADTIGGRAEMVEDINILARRLLSHLGEQS